MMYLLHGKIHKSTTFQGKSPENDLVNKEQDISYLL